MPTLDDLFFRLERRIPWQLDSEMRLEIKSMIALDIMAQVDKIIGHESIQSYIRQYKKLYPQRISLDDNSRLAQSLEG